MLNTSQINARLGSKMLFGGDYNPEQWSEDVWQQDVELMKEAGVNLVSVAIFGWARLEPVEGQYDFDWLDRVLDLLHANGISVNLATATASPPAWMALNHPETLPIDRSGVQYGFGSRQQYSPSSPIYREKAALLVRKMAERYKDHPALVMWHINNEYGCHIQECYAPHTAEAFRHWLEQKYQTIPELNRVWGTAFWSQGYQNWAEVQPPRHMPAFYNPTHWLDWRRFSSDMIQECLEMEVQILREITPDVPLNTNFLGFSKAVDQRSFAQQEDLVSIDIYPDPATQESKIDAALQSDWARSLKDGQPWIVMEQAPNQVQWRPINRLKKPGQMRLLSYSMVARGAKGILYFQWRQSISGSEKYHSGMVPHTGTSSRTWQEIRALGNELKALPELSFTPDAKVALILDWDAWQALEQESHPHTGLSLMEQIGHFYQVLWKQNILVDFVTSDHDLSGYQLVLAPSLPILSETAAANLKTYVQNGGHLVMSCFSGLADPNDHIYSETFNGSYNPLLIDMLGILIREFDPQSSGTVLELSNGWQAVQWADVLELQGATALASFTSDHFAGAPAITENQYGKGKAYHLGTQLQLSSLEAFLKHTLQNAGVQSPLEVPEGIEVVAWKDGTTFLINHTSQEHTVLLPAPMQNLLQSAATQTAQQELKLAPMDVAVLQPQTQLEAILQ
ncbi:beta-galactosidase [Deinococcus roseus]|uniref:Beta-galactosidase n=1 Tax=Deinococcus roseus TaxID=392414 RepID=A0ABQ2DJQ2_9DEIO|nr:beta-galactosidase [Deinococcus roseus]GGJ57683.1 beta-galactosidase [Deinococcus roseus]